jgi:hypothetical protein
VVNFGPFVETMNDEDFTKLCRLNRDLRIERTREGDLIIMPPTGGETGRRSFNLMAVFGEWVECDGTGIGFDSSTHGFHAAWRGEALSRSRLGEAFPLGTVEHGGTGRFPASMSRFCRGAALTLG